MSGVFIPARLVICVACAAVAVSVLISGAFADSASSSTIKLDDNTLLRLKWEQVSKNDELFSRLYELKCVPDVSAIHQDLSVQHFILREGFRYKSAMLLETAFVFEGRGKRLILDSQLPRIGDLKWEKDPAGAFFVIADFSGGNCWIGNPWYIISLETRHFLALLGRVGDVNKKDDGTLELSWTESRLETSPWLGHADSPYAKFYIAVKNTSLIADSRRNRQNFASALTRLEPEIARLKEELAGQRPSKADGHALLRAILERFLYLYLFQDKQEAWDVLRADLSYADPDCFVYSVRKGFVRGEWRREVTGKYQIHEMLSVIEQRMDRPAAWESD